MTMQLVLRVVFVLLIIREASAQKKSLARPGCQETCGGITIPYPFGIGANCSGDETFTVICNNSFTPGPPRPFLSNSSVEIIQISLQEGKLRVNTPIITADCENRTNNLDVRLVGPFSFSSTENRFTAMGCDNLAVITRVGTSIGGCASFCNGISSENSCFGYCCQTSIPPFLTFINPSLRSIDPNNNQKTCKYAFIVDQNWFSKLASPNTVRSMEQVPTVLDWRTYEKCNRFGTFKPTTNSLFNLCGKNAFCSNKSLCSCLEGYEGNPYMPDGCQDIDECTTAGAEGTYCQQMCINTPGSYYCSCNDGWKLVGRFLCVKINNDGRARLAIIGACTGLGVLFLFAATWWLYKVIQKRKKKKLKEKFFKRNGGLLLQQQITSGEGNIEKITLFTPKELDKATDHYNPNRILGQGGQGTVYKGMLADGRIVAVKKSKIEDVTKLEHFINEVVILSQINHRNIVKLHGCCLETEVPLLVYEFIPNGTLFEYIHDHNENFPLSWDMRIRVATEVAGALSYLHSAASIPIYHRDVKSTNILLDNKYIAKVADFGTSRLIAVDQTHLTTRVQGTFGYLDPEYFQSSQFTEKSDVYSFGVVLLELLTGQKPILPPRSGDEGRSLATLFISAMEENRLFDILDARVIREGGKEEMMRFADLANRCLDLNGRRRPTMKQVAAELEGIRMSNGAPDAQQHYEEAYTVAEINWPWDATSASMDSSANTISLSV